MKTTRQHADPLVTQILALLDGGQAHVSFEDAVKDFPESGRGERPHGLPYSAWQLLEHLRLAQLDILHFSDPAVSGPGGTGYKELRWPDDYWPKDPNPPSPGAWDESLKAIADDRERFEALLTAEGADLYTAFPWGNGQNLLREALLSGDHNAYHTGELVLLRRLLGNWKM
jgi:hypothetical protein